MNKKITAPLTHNPGNGRPQEHLAYLNAQEMAVLRRMNGNNMERGPRGLPSFADDSASSLGMERQPENSYSGGVGSSSYNARESSGTGGYGGSGYGGSSASVGSGGAWGGGGNAVTFSGNTLDSIFGSNRGSAITGGISSLTTSSGTDSFGLSAPTPGLTVPGSSIDSAAIAAAAVKDAIKVARESAAYKADSGGISTINAGPMGTPVQIGGGQISGALERVQSQAESPVETSPYSTMNLRGLTGPLGEPRMQPTTYGTNYQTAQIMREMYPDIANKYSQTRLTGALDKFSSAIPGEADIRRYGDTNAPTNIARVGINQIVAGFRPEKMLANMDTTGMRKATRGFEQPGSYSAGMTENWADPEEGAAYKSLASQSLQDALLQRNVSPEALNASNFVAANTKIVPGTKEIGEPVAGTQFLRDPTLRTNIASKNLAAIEGLRIEPASGSGLPGGLATIVTPSKISGYLGNVADYIKNAISPDATDEVSTSVEDSASPTGYFSQFSMTPDDIARLKAETISTPDISWADKLEMNKNIGALPGFMTPITRDEANVAALESANDIPMDPSIMGRIASRLDQSAASESPVQGETSVSPSQQGLTGAQEMAVEGETEDAGTAFKPFGLLGRGLSKLYNWNTRENLNEYVDATSQQKKEMEEANPAFVKWAGVVGVSPYHDMSYYDNWAESMGLRAPQTRFGGADSDIKSLPMIYADWNQGRNIPSPGDPLYTQYKEFIQARKRSRSV